MEIKTAQERMIDVERRYIARLEREIDELKTEGASDAVLELVHRLLRPARQRLEKLLG
ncbi:MAG: hypothetical protein ABFD89_15285 [Bryobacteraceae bacterium]